MEETDEHEEVLETHAYCLSAQVTKGYDFFWGNNELCYDSELNVVRSDRPRVRPRTWFCHMNEDERERLTREAK